MVGGIYTLAGWTRCRVVRLPCRSRKRREPGFTRRLSDKERQKGKNKGAQIYFADVCGVIVIVLTLTGLTPPSTFTFIVGLNRRTDHFAT